MYVMSSFIGQSRIQENIQPFYLSISALVRGCPSVAKLDELSLIFCLFWQVTWGRSWPMTEYVTYKRRSFAIAPSRSQESSLVCFSSQQIAVEFASFFKSIGRGHARMVSLSKWRYYFVINWDCFHVIGNNTLGVNLASRVLVQCKDRLPRYGVIDDEDNTAVRVSYRYHWDPVRRKPNVISYFTYA